MLLCVHDALHHDADHDFDRGCLLTAARQHRLPGTVTPLRLLMLLMVLILTVSSLPRTTLVRTQRPWPEAGLDLCRRPCRTRHATIHATTRATATSRRGRFRRPATVSPHAPNPPNLLLRAHPTYFAKLMEDLRKPCFSPDRPLAFHRKQAPPASTTSSTPSRCWTTSSTRCVSTSRGAMHLGVWGGNCSSMGSITHWPTKVMAIFPSLRVWSGTPIRDTSCWCPILASRTTHPAQFASAPASLRRAVDVAHHARRRPSDHTALPRPCPCPLKTPLFIHPPTPRVFFY